MNYLRRLKNSKGFTLTELIVVIALIAILMTSVALFAQPVRTMVGATNAKSETQTVAEIIGSDIERNLAYADKLKIYQGVNIGTKDFSSDINNFKTTASDTVNDPHMLIFHLDTSSSDLTKHTYKIYDISLKEHASFTTDLLNDKNNLRFNEAFYGNYEYFISVESLIADPTTGNTSYPQPNNARNKGYLTFRIEAFNFDGSTDASGNTIGLNADVLAGNATGGIKSIFAYRQEYLKSPSAATDDPFANILNYKVGNETVSFALENFTAKDAVSKVSVVHGEFDNSNPSNPKINYGTDIVVFYNVHKYNFTTTSS